MWHAAMCDTPKAIFCTPMTGTCIAGPPTINITRYSSNRIHTVLDMILSLRSSSLMIFHQCLKLVQRQNKILRCSSVHVQPQRPQTTIATAFPTNTNTNTNTSSSSPEAAYAFAMDENLQASIRKFDRMTPRPQNLQRILEVSSSASTIKVINAFLREEFRVRCAERICMLDEKIPHFAEIPELRQVYELHVQAFVEMRNHSPQADFIPVVRKIVERGRDMVPLMLKGFYRLVRSPGSNIDETFTNKFMNEFLLNRIGSNVLMSQYLAVATGDDPPHPTSIVDPHCKVTEICRETARDVRQLCHEETGFRPTIKVESYFGQDMNNFAFIPGAISYILRELLKNSAVATAKQHQTKKHKKSPRLVEDNSISVIVCADESRVMIHVGDRAGGIPFEVGQHIWSYLYSTKEQRKQQEEENTDMDMDMDKEDKQQYDDDHLESTAATALGGFGVGLPLSRLYANYLGGTINLVSLPGYGTHAYVFLPRLPEKMVETVPIRATGWEARNACNAEFIF